LHRAVWLKAIPWLIAAAAAIVSIGSVPGAIGYLGAGLACVTIAIATIDSRRFIIPDELNAAGLCLAIAHAAARHPDTMLWAVVLALIRGVVLLLLFLAVRNLYAYIRGRQGLGLGDVKLSGVAGAWLDWWMVPIAIELAVLAALSAYLLRQFVLGRSVSLTSRLPFGAFLAPPIWICWLLEAAWLDSL
jgi:leader peptidase (prepilin peptidase)/N-methyltransferase